MGALERGELDGTWRVSAGAPPHAQLAGVILADQFARNVYRGTARAFALDEKAREWANELRALPAYRGALPAPHRYFCLLPLMHSEQLDDQELLVAEVEKELALALEKTKDKQATAAGAAEGGEPSPAAKMWADIRKYAVAHRDVVAKWGRFPHRNPILGRASTAEEAAGLADGSIPRW